MYKVKVTLPSDNYLNDLQDIVRAFEPYLVMDSDADDFLECNYNYCNNNFTCFIKTNIWGDYSQSFCVEDTDYLLYKKLTKRLLKNSLYDFLSKHLQVTLPYGSLTGVRPTKLYRELALESKQPKQCLEDLFSVSHNKALLIEQCVQNQQGYINEDKNTIGLFLNIPFCPSRCNYCSFISTEVFRIKHQLPLYLDCVLQDIESAKQIIAKNAYKVGSIYIGGGTPSCIGASMLDSILSPLSSFGTEFTVEIGRPDTIDTEILDVLQKNNVNRISINPQTFNQKTLDKIGRKHTVEQIYTSYEMAKKYGFVINMDLIAMLTGETYEEFCHSVDCATSLAPQNITVHTLSIKRGSTLSNTAQKHNIDGGASMVEYAHSALAKNYLPYYMYRQKNTSDNLENVGFCVSGTQCKYNIDMMEESATIIGIGCGAMSKLITDTKIERFSAPKGLNEYCQRISDVLERKNNFYSNF